MYTWTVSQGLLENMQVREGQCRGKSACVLEEIIVSDRLPQSARRASESFRQ